MKSYLIMSALLLFTGVLLGAFGGHQLETRLSSSQLNTWHTGLNYLFIHSFGIFAASLLIELKKECEAYWMSAAKSFMVGIILFSGSLLLWALTQYKPLVFLTPIGGIAFLLGWGWIFYGAIKIRN